MPGNRSIQNPGFAVVRLAGAMLLALLLGCAGDAGSNSVVRGRGAGVQAAGNWAVHGRTHEEQRFSPLDQIRAETVSDLGLAWTLELDTNRGQETTPLVVDGIIYLTTAWSKVLAVDGLSGQRLWEYDPQVPGNSAVNGCCDVVNRGAAYHDGKVYVGTFDGRLIALDARSGRLIWSTVTVDRTLPYSITGAPRIVKGNVIIGNGGADLGVRGYVSAYDAQTGALAWRFYTVPRPDGKPDGAVSDAILQSTAAASWSDGAWVHTGGGGTVWDAIVFDEKYDQILIGVGNGSPWNHVLRSGGRGDNLFLSSIVALDASSGAYKWHYQQNPGESWDFTATQPIILATINIEGVVRDVLMQAPKNGFFYVIDRARGTLISAEKFARVNWAERVDLVTGRPVEAAGARYEDKPFLAFPSAFGAHSWFPMSYSPLTGLVYIPVQDIPILYEREADYRTRAGTFNTGVYSEAGQLPDDATAVAAIRASLEGYLLAWNPVTQKAAWKVRHAGPATAGTMVTAGNLVFEGTPQGLFQAFDATDGRLLWTYQAQTAVLGSPVTYSVGGVQHILVVAGAGGGFGLSTPFVDDKRRKPNGRVLAFKLGGRSTEPAFVADDLPSPVMPSDDFSPQQVVAGRKLYESTCGWCHGAGTLAGGVLPDLRRSPLLADRDAWHAVVIGGALAERGMVSFSRSMSAADAEAVRAYVAAKARILAAERR